MSFPILIPRVTLLCFLISLISFSVNAQSNGVPLEGRVVDQQTGLAIPGATLFLEEIERGIAADSSGFFRFHPVEPGIYNVVIRSVGYAKTRIEIDHIEGDFHTLFLEPELLFGEEVIITSSPIGRSVQYQPAQSFSMETLQQNAAPSIGEMLDGSPGVSTRSFGSAPARPVIRGMDGDRILILQNGERMGDLSSTAVDHAVAIDPLSMDRIEVVRGPASLLYGSSAIGGVVNLFSSDMPREWSAGTSGSIATHLASVNDMGAGLIRLQHGNERFAATGRIIYRDGGDIRTPAGRIPDTSLNNLSYGGGIGYRNGNFESSLSMNGMNYTYGLPEALDDPNERVEIRMNRMNIQSISTITSDRFIEKTEVRLHFSDYRHNEFELFSVNGGIIDEELEISFDQQTFSSSVIFQHRQAGPMHGAMGMSLNISNIVVGGEEALTPNASGFFLAGYLYEEIQLGNNLDMKLGFRGEYKESHVSNNELFTNTDEFDSRSDFIPSGAIGFNYRPGSNWLTGFQLSRAYRTPTIEELYSDAAHLAAGSYDIGDPALKNEIIHAADLFAEYRSQRFRTEISLFYNRINNFVQFTPTGTFHEPSGLPVFRYTSKNARFYGFETTFQVSLTDQLHIGLNVDYVVAEDTDNGNTPLAFIPPLKTTVNLIYDPGTWWLGSRFKMVSTQNKVAPNEETTDGYFLTGFDGGYRFGHGLTFAFRIDNLLNVRYRDHLSRVEDRNYPMPGLNMNAMLRWDF